MKSDRLYVDQILDSIRKIEEYTDKFDESKFLADEKTQSAVVMQLLVIGEISKKLSEETKSSASLPWRMIAGFRDRAIHNYFETDLKVVWDTVVNDIPVLKNALK